MIPGGADRDLVFRLKKGDESSFKEVYSIYYLRLFYFAREYVISESDAEDIVQNVFTKLWKNRFSLLDNTNLEAWLYKVTRNESLSMIDHRTVVKKFRNIEENKMLDINFHALKSLALPEDTLFDIRDIIEESLESLSPQCKKVFVSSRSKSYKEIAEQMSISIKTVESHMSKALATFRKALSDYLSLLIALFFI